MSKNRWNLNKSQRIQFKAFICILGIALLIILFFAKLFLFLGQQKEPDKKAPPVIKELKNVWIMEVGQEELLLYQDGEKCTYTYGEVIEKQEDGEETTVLYQVPLEAREQIADVTLTDECVTEVKIKKEKVNGKVLSADSKKIELEGIGIFPVLENMKGYRLYDSLSMCSIEDLRIGYDFADFVIEDGKVCGILMVKEEAMGQIRVLLKNADYGGLFHESLTFTGDTDFLICYGSYQNPMQELHKAGEECVIEKNSTYFQEERIKIVPTVLTGKILLPSVHRSQGIPAYRGTLELIKTEDGLVVINEVLLEEYLYSVVPSEMPASYPPEALKAQAVCARTYAYNHMLHAGYSQYGAHVDDSTSYQVYNNILEQEAATTAAKETYGQLLYTTQGQLADTYYYSTSCGLGSDATVWKTSNAEVSSYLKARAINYPSMELVLEQRNLAKAAEDGNMELQNNNSQEGNNLQEDNNLQESNNPQENTEGNSLSEEENRRKEEAGELEMIGQAMTSEELFAAFIKGKNADDFEVSESWYRWSYHVAAINIEHMQEVLQNRYKANEKLVLTLDENGEFVSSPITKLDAIKELYIAKRGSGGIAEELHIVTNTQTIKVITEHNIRYVLCDGETLVLRQDGKNVNMPNLLPSSFFVLNTIKEEEEVVGYALIGGGYGHGVGMSQNGAKAMAAAGYKAEDILAFFYEGCQTKSIY